MKGNDTWMVLGNFDKEYTVDDRLQLALYNATVMEIPDFAISPPSGFTPCSTATPLGGPNFTVSRNAAFISTVTLGLRGAAPQTPAIPNGTSCPIRPSLPRPPAT